MAVHWITFRLHESTIGGRSYQTRYDALLKAVDKHRQGYWWFEPTSFWLVDSGSTKAQIATSVKAAIATSHDLVLIGSMDTLGAHLVGNAEELATLKSLVPNLTVS